MRKGSSRRKRRWRDRTQMRGVRKGRERKEAWSVGRKKRGSSLIQDKPCGRGRSSFALVGSRDLGSYACEMHPD
jgi:hypothetical protein